MIQEKLANAAATCIGNRNQQKTFPANSQLSKLQLTTLKAPTLNSQSSSLTVKKATVQVIVSVCGYDQPVHCSYIPRKKIRIKLGGGVFNDAKEIHEKHL